MSYGDINAILGQLGRDKGIDKKVLIEALESAMLSAARKHYGHGLNLETHFNEESGEVELVQFKTVVERVEDGDTQIDVKNARKEFDADAMVGDELGRRLDTSILGRIAAQAAKQVIMQKVRDAERDVIYEEYKGSKGEIVSGIVQRFERGSTIINLGRTDAVLPRREQIMRERYNQGDRVRAMILDIDRSARGPQIILSRSHPDFLKKLFAIEVPEVGDGTIEIKAVAREPGERAKMAVHSNDSSVDPVGACVGIKGTRVQAVVQELRGERVDIITWTPDEPSFVARALAPAEVQRVVLDEDNHAMEVIVADDQLALAIGRRGQNVRLASKMTGWRIDVRSVSTAEEESKRARESLASIPEIEFTDSELLFQAGFRSVHELATGSLEDLIEAGVPAERAEKLLQHARDIAESQPAPQVAGVSDLDKLSLAVELRERLAKAGFLTIQSLVELQPDKLAEAVGLNEQELSEVKIATDTFLKVPRPTRPL